MSYKRFLLLDGSDIEITSQKHLDSIKRCKWFVGAIEIVEEEDIQSTVNNDEKPDNADNNEKAAQSTVNNDEKPAKRSYKKKEL